MNETIIRKLTSRKFWICVAAFLASVAASVAGLQSGNNVISGIGIACSVLSAAIYAAAEAKVDAAKKNESDDATN